MKVGPVREQVVSQRLSLSPSPGVDIVFVELLVARRHEDSAGATGKPIMMRKIGCGSEGVAEWINGIEIYEILGLPIQP